jgi:hypothetical protein
LLLPPHVTFRHIDTPITQEDCRPKKLNCRPQCHPSKKSAAPLPPFDALHCRPLEATAAPLPPQKFAQVPPLTPPGTQILTQTGMYGGLLRPKMHSNWTVYYVAIHHNRARPCPPIDGTHQIYECRRLTPPLPPLTPLAAQGRQ